MIDSPNDVNPPVPDPTTSTGFVGIAPPAAQTASQSIISHIESAGKDELAALKPLVAKIVRSFVDQWEAVHTTGVVGMVERKVITAVLDSVFGRAPTA